MTTPIVEHPDVRSAIDLPDDGETWAYVDQALEWVGSAIAGATKPTPPVADPDWQRYVGRYRNRWGDLQVIVHAGELTVIGIPGELVVFEVDATGRVRRARFGENYAERIESWEDPD